MTATATDTLTLSTDVLVIGGGPAATWAAINARDNGAEVVLVDKGYCGTSGATAPAGTGSGMWHPRRRHVRRRRPAGNAWAAISPTTIGWTVSWTRPTPTCIVWVPRDGIRSR